MKGKTWVLRGSMALTATALMGLGCAPLTQPLAALRPPPPQLEALGPGTVFASIECAAVDALIHAHLQAEAARDGRVRAGTIHATGEGYSYDEVVVAGPLLPDQVSYAVKPRDVARFQMYPRVGNHAVDRAAERLSPADRRSVGVLDPRHRPLYILHPSLAIREYRGEDPEPVEVAHLLRPSRPQRVAGAVPTPVQPICRLADLSDASLPPLRPKRRGLIPC